MWVPFDLYAFDACYVSEFYGAGLQILLIKRYNSIPRIYQKMYILLPRVNFSTQLGRM